MTLAAALPNPPDDRKSSHVLSAGQFFFDRYKIVRALGRGGFGVTFLARDVSLPGGPLCVIKQLNPKVENPAVLARASERFEREAKILSQLGSHSQIPRLLNYFQHEGEFFLVQEYVRGRTLAKEIRQEGPLSELEVKRFLWEILPVVDYIHRQQVVHRDIKPPNIIRCEDDNRLVLIDFGAVKEQIMSCDDTTQCGYTTQFVGTVGFAPPEQLALRPTYSTDIFALGVTCLFLLTGKTPMEFDYDLYTGEIIWEKHVEVSDHFAKVLAKMLKIAVSDRYQLVDQVMRALDLESYLPHLAGCMHNQPLQSLNDFEDDENGYLAPFAKTAREIRKWRKRFYAKRQRRGWQAEPLAGTTYL